MMTEQLIWFIDSRFYFTNNSLDKIAHLAKIHHKRITVIIDASSQSAGRGYWHLLEDRDVLTKELMTTIAKKEEQLQKYFSMNAIHADVLINQSANYIAKVNAQVANHDKCIVVIENNIVAKHHPIFQKLTEIKAPVLLLHNNVWKNPINILAAIDPLHEYESTDRIDGSIVSLAQNWARSLKAKWKIAHCCYVDSVLTKYKKNVLAMHRDGLRDIANKFRLPHEQCVLLEGTPEDEIALYIDKNHIDILAIGLVARNKLEQLWVGSTTAVLLNDLPCDMLLIKQ